MQKKVSNAWQANIANSAQHYNYLKEGLIQYGYWDKLGEDTQKMINSITTPSKYAF